MPHLILTMLLLVLVPGWPSGALAQTPWSTDIRPSWLNEVMPRADTFSDKRGDPPVIRAYRDDPETGGQNLIGYLFLSPDVPPEHVGYAAPIDMLIGMDLDGRLTGLKILDYQESYISSRGDFLAAPGFQAQFRDRSIYDSFRLGRQINGISGATLSNQAVARGARDAARRVARAYLELDEEYARQLSRAANARARLQPLSWQRMREREIVRELSVPMPSGKTLKLFLRYLGDGELGELFVGNTAWARARGDAIDRFGGGEMLLVAIGGDPSPRFMQEQLALQQGDGPARFLPRNRFLYAGNASEGKIADQTHYAGAVVIPEDIDTTRPFRLLYRPQGTEELHGIEYRLDELGLALTRGEPILSEEELEQARMAEAGVFQRLLYNAPWGDTPWGRVFMLLLIFSLVMAAFLRNSARLRWTALSLSLVYLGFIDGGFLSVSHITGALTQGPGIFLSNLPVLMIVVFTLVTTLLWGRIFCSSLCPFGALQDFMTRLLPRRWQWKPPQWIHDRALYIKYAVLALIAGAAVFYSQIGLFQYFEPFGTLFFFSSSVLLWAILLAILAACVIIPRFYCRYLCPLGAALGLLSLASPLRIRRVPQCQVCKVCEHACPTGAIRGPDIDFKECVRCDICERKLDDRAGVCAHDMEKVQARMAAKTGGRIPVTVLPDGR